METGNEHKEIAIREVIVNYKRTTQDLIKVSGSEDVVEFIRSILPDNSREHFGCLFLDTANQVINYSITSTGSSNQAWVIPREIFQRAILCGALGIILYHNHPSGQCEPSKEDHKATRLLIEGSKTLGLKILDHIIIGENKHFSFSDSGVL